MYNLKDKIVVVTGGSKGIGANFVKEVLEEGVQVISIFLFRLFCTDLNPNFHN